MKAKFLNISGIEVLSRESMKQIKGQAKLDFSKCGCDCRGSVTGPDYCRIYFACAQVYTCQEEM